MFLSGRSKLATPTWQRPNSGTDILRTVLIQADTTHCAPTATVAMPLFSTTMLCTARSATSATLKQFGRGSEMQLALDHTLSVTMSLPMDETSLTDEAQSRCMKRRKSARFECCSSARFECCSSHRWKVTEQLCSQIFGPWGGAALHATITEATIHPIH